MSDFQVQPSSCRRWGAAPSIDSSSPLPLAVCSTSLGSSAPGSPSAADTVLGWTNLQKSMIGTMTWSTLRSAKGVGSGAALGGLGSPHDTSMDRQPMTTTKIHGRHFDTPPSLATFIRSTLGGVPYRGVAVGDVQNICVMIPEPGRCKRLVITFQNVTAIYPNQDRPALDQINADIEKGEFVFLVGESGSGKSTFLRLILRETRPVKGKVFVAGKEIERLPNWKVPQLRRQIGTVFQDFRLLPNKTVAENVAFALQVIGKSKAHINKVVPETLEMVGLEGKGQRMTDELSGGEQQRVAIARAFVNRPQILIADEPTGNLDPNTSVDIMKLLDRINRTGTTVLMATHDANIVDQMRKRVIELVDGKVVRDHARGVYGSQA